MKKYEDPLYVGGLPVVGCYENRVAPHIPASKDAADLFPDMGEIVQVPLGHPTAVEGVTRIAINQINTAGELLAANL